jgi:hypothetical protein
VSPQTRECFATKEREQGELLGARGIWVSSYDLTIDLNPSPQYSPAGRGAAGVKRKPSDARARLRHRREGRRLEVARPMSKKM